MAKNKTEKSFEDAVSRLEDISEIMHSDNLPLEETISLFEEGAKLRHFCLEKLKEASLKIKQINKDYSVKDIDIENILDDSLSD